MTTATLTEPEAQIEATEATATYQSPVVWTGDEKISDVSDIGPKSNEGPGMAELNGNLHCAYRGASSDQLYEMTFDGTNWQGDTKIQVDGAGLESSRRPALVAVNGKLFMAYKASGSDQLCLAESNGTSWVSNEAIVGPDGSPLESDRPPALALFDDLIYMAYKAAGDGSLRLATYNGLRWTFDSAIADMPGGIGPRTSDGPSLAVFHSHLVMIYKGDSSDYLYQSNFDGSKWRGDVRISNQPKSSRSPAAVVFQNQLFVLYRGSSKTNIYQDEFVGTLWAGDVNLGSFSPINPQTTEAPGVGVLGDRMVMVFKGKSSSSLYQATATSNRPAS